ncbi:hypothetical protein TNCV_914541 [Trichonephila clavipes]|uniref:Uncharacterized protein n=1 Tax=Trichonephila clavipes TaxID=2585209 RepID=A0A8X6RIJ2_TRICX|nr:hypothetical protein TNCV_914541 [Trichonephila clavipes]
MSKPKSLSIKEKILTLQEVDKVGKKLTLRFLFLSFLLVMASEILTAVQISVPSVVVSNDVIAIHSSIMTFPAQYGAKTTKRADLVTSVLFRQGRVV